MNVDTTNKFYRRNSVIRQDISYTTSLGNRLGNQVSQIPHWGFWNMPAGVGPNNPVPARSEARGRGSAARLQQGLATTLQRIYLSILKTNLVFNQLNKKVSVMNVEEYIEGSPAFQTLSSSMLENTKREIEGRIGRANQMLELMEEKSQSLEARIERLRKKMGG